MIDNEVLGLAGAAAVVVPAWMTVVYRREARRAGAEIARARERAVRAEERAREAEATIHALVAELADLAEVRLPGVVLASAQPGATAPALVAEEFRGGAFERAIADLAHAFLNAVADERSRVDAAARTAMRGATSRIQSLLYQIRALVEQLQNEHDDPRLLEVDRRNEMALRRIQTTAILCDAWPGLARTDSLLAEIATGAKSRVSGYERIMIGNHLREGRLGVVARAAEPVAIAVAELLANATAYSPPQTEVAVSLQQGAGAALVIIDDAGVGMDDDLMMRARRLLADPSGTLLTELGDPPQTGHAVVGRLGAQYGFACHIEPSPYGGVRAIVRIPEPLLTEVTDIEMSVLAPQPVRAYPAEPAVELEGLPTRRRRQPQAQPAPRDITASFSRTPEQAATRWAALQHGTGTGRAAAQETVPEFDI